MASFLDVCRFNPASSGTGSFVVSSAVNGYQTPASAGAVNLATYRYRAESADLTQWEVGYGIYTVSTTTLTRATILFNSSGGTSAINFTLTPQVAIVALAEDLPALTLRSYLAGLVLSTAGASTTFGIAAGVATDSTSVSLMSLASAFTKTTGAWAVGTGNGALDTGAIAASTWYHAYLIQRVDTGLVDVLVSLSATSPTMPTNYTLSRLIGSMLTDGSSHWTAFQQDGDTFRWLTGKQDIAATNPGTSAVTRTMSTPLNRRLEGIFRMGWLVSTTNPAAMLLSDLSLTDEAPSVTGAIQDFNADSSPVTTVGQVGVSGVRVFTNTSSQIRSRVALSGSGDTFWISTMGWIDRRGRDA